jgi:riboflavin synthase
MFTGIVTERGTVGGIVPTDGGVRLSIAAPETAVGLVVGDSVAVSGVCLTALAVDESGFEAEAVAETLARTTLGALGVGDVVNLERPVLAGGRLDGHVVQGHVDGVAVVGSVTAEGESTRVRFDAPAGLLGYVAEKGSVALDGVSLTVTAVDRTGFEVVLIPHTRAATTLGAATPGARVNLEVDVLAKYVERLMEARR